MNKVKLNEAKTLEVLSELKGLLSQNHDVSIPELDSLENIVKNKNHENSNMKRTFSFAFRRVQEIGIYDEKVDRLFGELHYLILIDV